jgi:Big-like domain-containing protein
MPTFSLRRLGGLFIATGLVACGSGDLTFPADRNPASLRAVSGDGQEGTVGSKLRDPLVVRLTDGSSRPVPGASLRFQSDAPDAELNPASVETDDSGRASIQVRLGTTTGTQTIEARLSDAAPSDIRATFGLTALARKGKGGGGGNDGDHGHGHGHGGDDDGD